MAQVRARMFEFLGRAALGTDIGDVCHFIGKKRPITFAMRGDRVAHPALGLFGGEAGAPGAVSVNKRPIHSKRTILLNNGDLLELQTPGGGGYGPPAERAPIAREADVRNEYVAG